MVDLAAIIEALKHYKLVLEVFRSLKRGWDHIRRLPAPALTFDDATALSEAFYSTDIPDGQLVVVEGILSRYSHLHAGRVFYPFLPGSATFASDEPNIRAKFFLKDPAPNGLVIPKGFEFNYLRQLNRIDTSLDEARVELRLPYLPVTALPDINSEADGSTYRLCFLYPKSSVGFTALPPPIGRSGFHVPVGARGIPVLVPSSLDISSYHESTCSVRAYLKTAPARILEVVPHINRQLRRDLVSAFYRPDRQTRKGFYLIAAGATAPLETSAASTKFQATIFVEGHIGGMKFEAIHDVFQSHTLEHFSLLTEEVRNGFSPALVRLGDMSALGLERGSIVAKAPNLLGMYTTVDLRDSNAYSSAYRYLRQMFEQFEFAVDALAHGLRKKFALPVPQVSLRPDFLFDFECQQDFLGGSVLGDPELFQPPSGLSNLHDVADWLRQGKEPRK